MRLDGLSMLREIVGDHKMDLKWDGGYELFFDKNPKKLNQIDYVNSILKPFFQRMFLPLIIRKLKNSDLTRTW